MPKITKFDRPTADLIANLAAAHLATFAKDHGLTVRRGKGKYDTTTFELVMKFEIDDQVALAEREQREFEIYCSHYRLRPDDYLKIFTCRGEKYYLVGFMPSRPKFAIRGRHVQTGKEMLFSTPVVRHLQIDFSKLAAAEVRL